jgi:hypothetical protein
MDKWKPNEPKAVDTNGMAKTETPQACVCYLTMVCVQKQWASHDDEEQAFP